MAGILQCKKSHRGKREGHQLQQPKAPHLGPNSYKPPVRRRIETSEIGKGQGIGYYKSIVHFIV